jgi:hypothetical protein
MRADSLKAVFHRPHNFTKPIIRSIRPIGLFYSPVSDFYGATPAQIDGAIGLIELWSRRRRCHISKQEPRRPRTRPPHHG